MEIIKAKKIGFCFGVKRSINLAKQALDQEETRSVFLLGNIVHNEEVIKDIESKGGKVISSLDEAQRDSLVVAKAHGVSPKILEEAKEKRLEIKDTTCPIVETAQKKAQKLKDEGCQVIIIGEKTHPETQVIQEHAGKDSIITEREEEIESLELNSPVGVIAQTTKKRHRVEELLDTLKKKKVEIKWEDTICNEVSDRQEELKQLLNQVQGVVVIGSRTSANTTRLAEIVKTNGKKLWWINSVEELPLKDMEEYSKIGVVSGTSAPDWEVEKIIKFLEKK